MLLTQACPREELKILAVNTDYRHKRHLENLSVMKGADITCLYNRTGDIIIKVKDGRLAINREFASSIEVESLTPTNYEEIEKYPRLKSFISKIPLINRIKKINEWFSNVEMKRVPTKAARAEFKKEDEKFIEQEKLRKKQLKERNQALKNSDKEAD